MKLSRTLTGNEALATLTLKADRSDVYAEYRDYLDTASGLTVCTRRSLQVKDFGDFLPGIIKDSEGKVLWTFKSENFTGFGTVVVVGGEFIIALVGNHKVQKVIPVQDLPKIKQVKTNDGTKHIGGRGTQQTVLLKHAVAEALGFEAELTVDEKSFLAKIRTAEETRNAKKNAEKSARRLERVAKIMARPTISGYPERGGKCRFGIPVLADEWPMLESGTGVVLISAFDENEMPVGDTAEAFFTGRDRGGRPEKNATTMITLRGQGQQGQSVANRNEVSTTIDLSSCEEILVEVTNGDYREAYLTDSAGLTSLKKSGLNSGTLVAIPVSGNTEKVQVIEMSKGCPTLGIFQKM